MKSPFILAQNFLSPLMCEKIINDVHISEPDKNQDDTPRKSERYSLFWESELRQRFQSLIPEIEERYNAQYRGLEKPLFQYYPENAKIPAEQAGCENAKYFRRKWVQYKDVDLVGFIWLKDYNDSVPLDNRYEIFGGKLEFPAYNFSLVPQRGTLVMFPAGPHFITVISPILVSDLYQIKLTVCISAKDGSRWIYQPAHFPGKWQNWFSGHY